MKRILQGIWIAGWLICLALSDAFCTTVPNPSIRYTISNQTKQRVTNFIQIESDDTTFLITDTVRIVPGLQEGLLTVQSQHDSFKPYQRLIIQTDQQQYQTPALALDGNCTAYSIQITRTGLLIQEDYSFRLRRWAIEIIIVCLFTFAIKGIPLLLTAIPYISKVYVPFTVLNGIFIICFLVLGHYSFGRPVQAGPIEPKVYYLVLLAITVAECFWYYNLEIKSKARTRLLAGAVLGSLFWIFPGFLMTVFALFLFAHC